MFLLDANVFITPSRTYYGVDLVPSYWEWLEDGFSKADIASIESVKDELLQGNDWLANWVNEPKISAAWLAPGKDAADYVEQLMEWAMDEHSGFSSSAIDEFADSADLMLIAQAAEGDHTIVTFEESNPRSRRRILIPDAAKVIGVACVKPWEMERTLGMSI